MWRAVLLLTLVTPSPGQQSRPNRVVGVTTICDKGSITVNVEMEMPFKGLVFSRDFSRECRVQGQIIIVLHFHVEFFSYFRFRPENGRAVSKFTKDISKQYNILIILVFFKLTLVFVSINLQA